MLNGRLLLPNRLPLLVKRYLATQTITPIAASKMEGDTAVRSNPVVANIAEAPEFKSIFNGSLNCLIDIFKRNNYDLRIAGGAVRDLLLHKTPTDLDFATVATPSQMKDMFTAADIRMINMNGEKHGTITPRIDDDQFEVTTLRIDVLTDGRHAEVQFTNDWQVDANRRDLTINSMFVDFDGNVYDYFYGYDDLKKRRVAFVGAPEKRIQEDYLRILRYFRFYGRTADQPDQHDKPTIAAIERNIEGLQKISGERIWGELKKILQGRFAKELILELIGCGAAKFIGLPENPNLDEFKRVCDANQDFADNPANPITLFAGLLNTEEDAFQLHQRLKFSAYERDLAKFLALNKQATRSETDLLFYQKQCFNTLNSVALHKNVILELLKYNHHSKLFWQLNEWAIPQFPLNGPLLLANGCPGGQRMGAVQSQMRDLWKESAFTLDQEELLQRLPAVIEAVKEAKPSPPKKRKESKHKSREAVQ